MKKISFKIEFKNPKAVSSTAYGLDNLSVSIKHPKLLVSEDGLQIDLSSSGF